MDPLDPQGLSPGVGPMFPDPTGLEWVWVQVQKN